MLPFGSVSRFPDFSGKLKLDHYNTLTANFFFPNTCCLTITIPANKRYAGTGTPVMVTNLPLISWKTFLRLMGLCYHERDNEDVTGCS